MYTMACALRISKRSQSSRMKTRLTIPLLRHNGTFYHKGKVYWCRRPGAGLRLKNEVQ